MHTIMFFQFYSLMPCAKLMPSSQTVCVRTCRGFKVTDWVDFDGQDVQKQDRAELELYHHS